MRVAVWILAGLAAVAVAALAPVVSDAAGFADPGEGLPPTLHETGWDPSSRDLLPFSPQYPLWTDGAAKRRWIQLPAGTSIDAARPDAWEFPNGTRLWKEFSFDGRPVETRIVEKTASGRWRFGTYVWNEAGTQATLAPRRGLHAAVEVAPGKRHRLPSRDDCMACHGSNAVPVLGVSALQLSEGELNLRALVARGLLRNLPQALLDTPPRIAARDGVERAALGYLHGNCAHCHNTGERRVPVNLTLAQRVADPEGSRAEVLRSAVNAASRWRPEDASDVPNWSVVAPGNARASALVHRMQTDDPFARMPPIGTAVPDAEGIASIQRWIAGIR